MASEGYTPTSLEESLGYNSDGLLVKMYLGELSTEREPSDPFCEKLEGLGFDGKVEPKSRKIAMAAFAKREPPPGTVVLGEPRQCPECVAEAEEGKRAWTDTWYIFPWGNQKYCCEAHRRAWYRRQNCCS